MPGEMRHLREQESATATAGLSPVVVFVYNRPEHTRKLFESLIKCPEIFNTDLVIFSDGPRSEDDIRCVAQVRTVVAEYTKDLNCRIVFRTSNFGLAASVISGVSEVMSTSNSVIVLEDDLIVSEDFLTFMNWGLRKFKLDQRIFSLTGFSFPVNYFSLPKGYKHSVFLSPRCNSWSWATWRDRWEVVDWEMSELDNFISDRKQRSRFNRIGWDLSRMLRFQKSGWIDSWAIRFCFAHFNASAYCLHPVSTLVHNTGLDGTGTHSWKDRRFEHHDAFARWSQRTSDTDVNPDTEINEEIYRIFAGQSGPLLSRIRGVLSRSWIGRLLQTLVLSRKAMSRVMR